METLRKRYSNLIDNVYSDLKSDPNYDKNRDEYINQKFQKVLLPKVQECNQLKITLDNYFAKVILLKMEDINLRFDNFKSCEKKVMFYQSLARVLKNNHFICKWEWNQIEKKCSQIRNSTQYKWNSTLTLIQYADDQAEFRSDFFDKYLGEEVDQDIEEEQVKNLYEKFWQYAFSQSINRQLLVKIDNVISKFENKKDIYDPQLFEKIEDNLGHQIGSDDAQIEINKKLRQIAQQQHIDANIEVQEFYEEKYKYLKKVLGKFCGMTVWKENKVNMYVDKFGSNVSGFASRLTDYDITLLTDCYIDEVKVLELLHKFLTIELKDASKKQYKLQLVKTARIPLIKLSLMKFEKTANFDIIVNNILGVINSKFLSVYSQVKWIKNLGVLIKTWGKKVKIVNQRMFSSYSMILLLLHFLIIKNKVNLIMDARNRSQDTPSFEYRRVPKGEAEEFKVYYKFKQQKQSVTEESRVSLYGILTDFFSFYSDKGEHWKKSSNEQIITVDGSMDKDFDDQYIFTIRDPFDERHNPGRVKKKDEEGKVMSEFTEAYETMKSKNAGYIIKKLFQQQL